MRKWDNEKKSHSPIVSKSRCPIVPLSHRPMALDLYLLAHARNGDVQHFAVLSHRAAGNAITLIVEDIHQVLVRKRMTLILHVDALLQYLLYLVRRYLLAR